MRVLCIYIEPYLEPVTISETLQNIRPWIFSWNLALKERWSHGHIATATSCYRIIKSLWRKACYYFCSETRDVHLALFIATFQTLFGAFLFMIICLILKYLVWNFKILLKILKSFYVKEKEDVWIWSKIKRDHGFHVTCKLRYFI